MSLYQPIIAALLPAEPALNAATERDIAQFVERTIRLAPWHLRMGVRAAETALLFWLIFTAKGFVSGAPERIALRNSLSRFGNLTGVTATLIRLYRSLALLAWAERDGAAS